MSYIDNVRVRLKEFDRPYRRLEITPGDPGPLAVTKLSGVPWWPEGIKRPRCVSDHLMSFIAQFRVDEAPGFERRPLLLSFHYCNECTYRGQMAWGWRDRGRQLKYRVSLLSDLDRPIDELGTVAESPLAASSVRYGEGVDNLNLEEIWRLFPKTSRPGGLGDLKIVNEDGPKIGGWPSWVQSPEWPEDQMGDEMQFLAQLDWQTCPNCSWCSGGYAYLFVSLDDEDEKEAELMIQTT